MPYDVVIVGGGPAGLSAALALGRGRKRVLLCDAGPPRNAAAEHVPGFVQVDEMLRETSQPGLYAGGDLITPAQGVVIAAGSGNLAAVRLNHALTVELVTSGALP